MSLSPIEETCRRSLRSVRWRIDLGILPSSPVASVDDLRRASADSRRRYASLRRKLLVNPQLIKDKDSRSDPSIDNPLSQNPESMWGKYFRNAELESTIDQDLTRLYGNSYFQTASCQFILKRILLLWGLQHPHYNYRQGMHELLAPLVYVLHIDQVHLKTLQKLHSNFFTENFEEESLFSPQTLKNPKNGSIPKATTFDDLDPEKKQIILLTDPYGSEGELGVVLSEKFMEHDAYSMFDGLMDGGNNYSVSMAEFFSSSNSSVKIPILPPVIEASSALYHLLSLVDHSLHSHLIELGVEPQYFALRWLRVLFGREFELENLLLIWDEIFSYDNKKESNSSSTEIDAFRVLSSDRGTFIAAFAVSMILHLRPALLATENITICLQKLLNFPSNVEIHNLLQKSKDLFKIATSSKVHHHEGSNNKTPPHHSVPSSYWEEKWRVLHKTESLPLPIENKSGNKSNMDSVYGGPPTKKKSLRERFGLSRAGSDGNSSFRKRLFDEVEKTEGLNANSPCKSENVTINNSRILENNDNDDDDDDGIVRVSNSVPNYVRSNMKEIVASESVQGEENSSSSSSCSVSIERENFENDTDKSSVTSNSFLCEIAEIEGVLGKNGERESEKIEEEHIVEEDGREKDEDVVVKGKEKGKEIEKGKGDGVLKESRSGKFGWFWKFGKGDNNNNNNSNNNNNLVINEGGETKIEKESSNSNSMSNPDSSSTNSNSHSSSKINPDFNHNANTNFNSNSNSTNSDSKSCSGGNSVKPENSGDKKVTGTFKNLGQSMLDNIQVIESVFQQDRGKGQATAMAALTELRKISNLLREI